MINKIKVLHVHLYVIIHLSPYPNTVFLYIQVILKER